MRITPSNIEAWQDADHDPDAQPTCYQARDPVAPWRAAESELSEDYEDVEFAREYVATGGHVGSPCGRRTASPPPEPAPPAAPATPAVDLAQTVIHQLNTLRGAHR